MPRVFNIPNAAEVLKRDVLPWWENSINVEADLLYQKIGKINALSDIGEFGTQIGIGGGYGAAAEGYATPEAFATLYGKFNYRTKDLYCNIMISEKAFRLTDAKGAYMTFMNEIESQRKAAVWNSARMLYGDGSAILCYLTDGEITSGTVTNADGVEIETSTFKVDDIAGVIEGLVVDLHTWGTAGATSATLTENNKLAQIIAIDRAAKTVTVAKSGLTAATKHNTASKGYGFLTPQGSYGKEYTGLKSIFDPETTKLYGVEKSKMPSIVPYTMSAENQISNVLIHHAVRTVNRNSPGNVNMLIFGDDAYLAYLEMLQETNVQVVTNNKYRNGFATTVQVVDNKEIEVYNSPFVPSGEVWGIDTDLLKLYQTGWEFVKSDGASVFTLINDTSVHRALLANYGELIAKNTGAFVRITDAASA